MSFPFFPYSFIGNLSNYKKTYLLKIQNTDFPQLIDMYS